MGRKQRMPPTRNHNNVRCRSLKVSTEETISSGTSLLDSTTSASPTVACPGAVSSSPKCQDNRPWFDDSDECSRIVQALRESLERATELREEYEECESYDNEEKKSNKEEQQQQVRVDKEQQQQLKRKPNTAFKKVTNRTNFLCGECTYLSTRQNWNLRFKPYGIPAGTSPTRPSFRRFYGGGGGLGEMFNASDNVPTASHPSQYVGSIRRIINEVTASSNTTALPNQHNHHPEHPPIGLVQFVLRCTELCNMISQALNDLNRLDETGLGPICCKSRHDSSEINIEPLLRKFSSSFLDNGNDHKDKSVEQGDENEDDKSSSSLSSSPSSLANQKEHFRQIFGIAISFATPTYIVPKTMQEGQYRTHWEIEAMPDKKEKDHYYPLSPTNAIKSSSLMMVDYNTNAVSDKVIHAVESLVYTLIGWIPGRGLKISPSTSSSSLSAPIADLAQSSGHVTGCVVHNRDKGSNEGNEVMSTPPTKTRTALHVTKQSMENSPTIPSSSCTAVGQENEEPFSNQNTPTSKGNNIDSSSNSGKQQQQQRQQVQQQQSEKNSKSKIKTTSKPKSKNKFQFQPTATTKQIEDTTTREAQQAETERVNTSEPSHIDTTTTNTNGRFVVFSKSENQNADPGVLASATTATVTTATSPPSPPSPSSATIIPAGSASGSATINTQVTAPSKSTKTETKEKSGKKKLGHGRNRKLELLTRDSVSVNLPTRRKSASRQNIIYDGSGDGSSDNFNCSLVTDTNKNQIHDKGSSAGSGDSSNPDLNPNPNPNVNADVNSVPKRNTDTNNRRRRSSRKIKSVLPFDPTNLSLAQKKLQDAAAGATGIGFPCPSCCGVIILYGETKCPECNLNCQYEPGVGVVILRERNDIRTYDPMADVKRKENETDLELAALQMDQATKVNEKRGIIQVKTKSGDCRAGTLGQPYTATEKGIEETKKPRKRPRFDFHARAADENNSEHEIMTFKKTSKLSSKKSEIWAKATKEESIQDELLKASEISKEGVRERKKDEVLNENNSDSRVSLTAKPLEAQRKDTGKKYSEIKSVIKSEPLGSNDVIGASVKKKLPERHDADIAKVVQESKQNKRWLEDTELSEKTSETQQQCGKENFKRREAQKTNASAKVPEITCQKEFSPNRTEKFTSKEETKSAPRTDPNKTISRSVSPDKAIIMESDLNKNSSISSDRKERSIESVDRSSCRSSEAKQSGVSSFERVPESPSLPSKQTREAPTNSSDDTEPSTEVSSIRKRKRGRHSRTVKVKSPTRSSSRICEKSNIAASVAVTAEREQMRRRRVPEKIKSHDRSRYDNGITSSASSSREVAATSTQSKLLRQNKRLQTTATAISVMPMCSSLTKRRGRRPSSSPQMSSSLPTQPSATSASKRRGKRPSNGSTTKKSKIEFDETTLVLDHHAQVLNYSAANTLLPVDFGTTTRSALYAVETKLEELDRKGESQTPDADYVLESKVYKKGVSERKQKADAERLEKLRHKELCEQQRIKWEYSRPKKKSPQEIELARFMSRPIKFVACQRNSARMEKCDFGRNCELCFAEEEPEEKTTIVNLPIPSFRQLPSIEAWDDHGTEPGRSRPSRNSKKEKKSVDKLTEMKHTLSFIAEFNDGYLRRQVRKGL